MKLIHPFIIVTLSCCLSLAGKAQYSYNGSINPSASIQPVVTFSLTSNASPTITFNVGSYYVSGYSVSNFSTVAVKSNMPWNFYISSATAYFTNSGTYSTANTPASILTYNIEGSAAKVVLSSTAKLLKSGTSGTNTVSGNTFNIGFSAQPGYTYGPGTYTISTVYTISAQ